ncbi:MAG: hypothetical protein R2788_19085 [Saprospiraceae bacterium]
MRLSRTKLYLATRIQAVWPVPTIFCFDALPAECMNQYQQLVRFPATLSVTEQGDD